MVIALGRRRIGHNQSTSREGREDRRQASKISDVFPSRPPSRHRGFVFVLTVRDHALVILWGPR